MPFLMRYAPPANFLRRPVPQPRPWSRSWNSSRRQACLIQRAKAGRLHDRCPAIGVGFDLTGELRRRISRRVQRKVRECSCDPLDFQRVAYDAIEGVDGFGGGLSGNKHAEPFGELQRAESRL